MISRDDSRMNFLRADRSRVTRRHATFPVYPPGANPKTIGLDKFSASPHVLARGLKLNTRIPEKSLIKSGTFFSDHAYFGSKSLDSNML